MFGLRLNLIRQQIFRRVWPGSLRYIAKNFYTVVIFVDPATRRGIEFLTLIDQMISQNVPFRFGAVFVTDGYREYHSNLRSGKTNIDNNLSAKIVRLFSRIRENHGTRSALQFFKSVL